MPLFVVLLFVVLQYLAALSIMNCTGVVVCRKYHRGWPADCVSFDELICSADDCMDADVQWWY